MDKFSGNIGFALQEESLTSPGVWNNTIVEKKYYGDVLKNYHKYSKTDGVNDNIALDVQLSIVADSYAKENLGFMRYVWYRGHKWCITSIDDTSLPRIILSLGGLYNGQ